jgi:hypothetical protein
LKGVIAMNQTVVRLLVPILFLITACGIVPPSRPTATSEPPPETETKSADAGQEATREALETREANLATREAAAAQPTAIPPAATDTPAEPTAAAQPPRATKVPTQTPVAPIDAATDQSEKAMNPKLENAVKHEGWDFAKGLLKISDENIITATVKKNMRWGYVLTAGVKEYALYFKAEIGSNGDACFADLGFIISPNPSYPNSTPSFMLIRDGSIARYALYRNDWDDNGSLGKTLITKPSPLIKIGKGEYNEVVITVQKNIVAAYVNDSQVVQYTGMSLLETGPLELRSYRSISDNSDPACIFRDVQLFIPN